MCFGILIIYGQQLKNEVKTYDLELLKKNLVMLPESF